MPRKRSSSRPAKAADIRTVAALAKVSIATVSRTVNGSPAVSERLSKRVWQAIEQLNYFPNTHARSLVSGRSRLFGIIVENITNPFFPELIQSFEEVAVANGYEILVSSSNSDPAVLTTCVRRMIERKVEGVAVLTFGEEESVLDQLDQLAQHSIPLVLAEFKLHDEKSSTILLDYTTGIRAAVEHLAALGHSKIGFLAGPHTLHSAITRENDFRAAMSALALPIHPEWIIECDHTLKGGVGGFERLQKLAKRPTAIVCSNDMTAIGVLRAAYMAGLRVPHDLSVIGLDDIAFAEYTLPPLTTIRMSRVDLARAAFEALRLQAEAEPGAKTQREFLVSTTLVVRGSTAAPPQNH
ncbi:LacI family DNA-binding transcriptional regulator [Terracidiphilus gabretensis]|uniref:LacI family DNA-binding transcriptional regulator n=1 Tax=Terracidiphilus gabretensis TaxID=1577687 RepID=UPI00071B3535|nr:LacI family DNA-binding transcriptional regulator [Terracidiphilus gabretensis]